MSNRVYINCDIYKSKSTIIFGTTVPNITLTNRVYAKDFEDQYRIRESGNKEIFLPELNEAKARVEIFKGYDEMDKEKVRNSTIILYKDNNKNAYLLGYFKNLPIYAYHVVDEETENVYKVERLSQTRKDNIIETKEINKIIRNKNLKNINDYKLIKNVKTGLSKVIKKDKIENLIKKENKLTPCVKITK